MSHILSRGFQGSNIPSGHQFPKTRLFRSGRRISPAKRRLAGLILGDEVQHYVGHDYLNHLLSSGSLSELDFGVMEHGFLPHGRDYRFLIEDSLCSDPGTYELIFTHVVDLRYETRVSDAGWQQSWSDDFTDYAQWIQADEPEG